VGVVDGWVVVTAGQSEGFGGDIGGAAFVLEGRGSLGGGVRSIGVIHGAFAHKVVHFGEGRGEDSRFVSGEGVDGGVDLGSNGSLQ